MKNLTYIHRPAFSMLELVFVIVILGIVASIGSEMIAKMYSSYIAQRATHRSSSKTEIAATIIANRLAYAMPHTLIARNEATNTKESLEGLTTANANATVLQWIGYDSDSFGANKSDRKPGWSGFADINGSSATSISTPGSNLDLTTTIIPNLSSGTIDNAAIFFPQQYTVATIGYSGYPTDISGLTKITSIGTSGEIIKLASPDLTGKNIKEHYKIAWSSYAIVPVKADGSTCATNDFPCDLVLRYDFQPWNGSYYTTAKSKLLIKNISVFRFTGSGNTIRFKICQEENIGSDYNITTCKEKAVIR